MTDHLTENARLRAALDSVVASYDRSNPMRTADMHLATCRCLRCTVDEARDVLATPAPDAVQAGDLMARFSDAMVAESQPPSDEVREAARLIAEVTDIAHCGGLRGMSESDALIAIRRTTLPFFKRAITRKVEP